LQPLGIAYTPTPGVTSIRPNPIRLSTGLIASYFLNIGVNVYAVVLNDIYWDGYRAYFDMTQAANNPYNRYEDPAEYKAWEDGYTAAHNREDGEK
jgi:hypothetical protein